MKDRVQFFSIYDMSIPHYFERAEGVVQQYQDGWRPDDINDVIELYNIWLFVENGVESKSWDEEVLEQIRNFKQEVASFFNQSSLSELYAQVIFEYRENFWEIIDRFNIRLCLSIETLRDMLVDKSYELRHILKQRRLVEKHGPVIAQMLRENEYTAEWLLSEYVEGKGLNIEEKLYFPVSLSLSDRENIISSYLDKDEPNLNYVRLVLVAKKDTNLRLSDEIILKARKVERTLNDRYFQKENAIQFKYALSIVDDTSKPLKWIEYDETATPVLCYSKPIMLKPQGAEFIHYCRFGFEFLNQIGIVELISKQSESSVFERIVGLNGKYSYITNMVFRYREAISMMQIQSLYGVLQSDGRSLESAIKDFYERYLRDEYGYPSTILSLPETSMSWVAKCRVIAPEIDAVAKRHQQYAKRGNIDEELLQISTDSVRITNVISCNPVRYYALKGMPSDLCRLFHLFFSDQSMLTYVEPFKDMKYASFFKLLFEQEGKIPYEKYAEYQLRDIDYLIDLGYLKVTTDGYIVVVNKVEISLLKYLYEYHCIPAPAHKQYLQCYLNEMLSKGWVEEDAHLLASEERNYFDFYMYNSTYTNGPALRNRYVHGATSSLANDDVHMEAYFRLLILLILTLLKIEDDLAYNNES